MDVQQQYVALCTVVLISIVTFGLCSAQELSLSDLISDGPMAGDYKPRDRRMAYSTFDPEMDWSRQETDPDADNTLVNFMKRDMYAFNSGSRRFPRINRRKIIPFYQYGNEFQGYRSSPRYTSPRRYSYFVSPWKMGGNYLGNRAGRAFGGPYK